MSLATAPVHCTTVAHRIVCTVAQGSAGSKLWQSAAVGLVGAVVGAGITGGITLRAQHNAAREAREATYCAWLRRQRAELLGGAYLSGVIRWSRKARRDTDEAGAPTEVTPPVRGDFDRVYWMALAISPDDGKLMMSARSWLDSLTGPTSEYAQRTGDSPHQLGREMADIQIGQWDGLIYALLAYQTFLFDRLGPEP